MSSRARKSSGQTPEAMNFFLYKIVVFVGVLEQPSNHILMICI